MKAWWLRLHRWIVLLFALPLTVVIITGLVLSFEPWLVVRAIQPGSLTLEKTEAILNQHDPRGQARGLAYRSHDDTLTLGGGRGGGTVVDVASGQVRSRPSAQTSFMGTSRRLHETLIIGARWLVITSTVAMILIILLGVLMGLPRFANTLGGWHKAIAWGLLPFLILSPLTGLFMSAGLTFMGLTAVPSSPRDMQLSLAQAVKVVAREHDLSALVWIRPQGGRMLARLAEGGEFRVFAVTLEGVTALPRNWPRLWHEGNFAGAWSAAMNVIISLAMMGLLGTGLWIWLGPKLRRRVRRSVTA